MSLLVDFVSMNRRWCQGLLKMFPSFFSWPDSSAYMNDRVEKALARGPSRILEVGGVDRPFLPKSSDYFYAGLDIEERPHCYEVYDSFLVQSVEQPVAGKYDLVLSKTLLEHVPDNQASFKAMCEGLDASGEMIHMIPMKGHPYALILRAVGPRMQKQLLHFLHPRNESVTGYPTFFNHCTAEEIRSLLEENGMVEIDIRCFYMASDYFKFLMPLFVLVFCFEKICQKLEWKTFAALIVVSARAPAEASSQSRST